jgi:hypothetical protein
MASDPIDIRDLDKAAVLAALYNHARPQGLGNLHYLPGEMTIGEAQALLRGRSLYFDYVHGRVLKIDLSGPTLDPGLYDRDNGPGAAAQTITRLREQEGKP